MAPVHHRMPVILRRAYWDEWLRPEPLSAARLEELLVPPPGGLFDIYHVGRAVNDAP